MTFSFVSFKTYEMQMLCIARTLGIAAIYMKGLINLVKFLTSRGEYLLCLYHKKYMGYYKCCFGVKNATIPLGNQLCYVKFYTYKTQFDLLVLS